MPNATAATSATASLKADGHVTKNTVRFVEQDAQGETVEREDAVIGTLYIPKATLTKIGDPVDITVTVEAQ